jgi:hypothetical protein
MAGRLGVAMPPYDASNRNSDDWARLRQYVESMNTVDKGRDRPGPVSCKRPQSAPAVSAYDEDDDGPITTRWGVG